jgi:hypothetical protein
MDGKSLKDTKTNLRIKTCKKERLEKSSNGMNREI